MHLLWKKPPALCERPSRPRRRKHRGLDTAWNRVPATRPRTDCVAAQWRTRSPCVAAGGSESLAAPRVAARGSTWPRLVPTLNSRMNRRALAPSAYFAHHLRFDTHEALRTVTQLAAAPVSTVARPPSRSPPIRPGGRVPGVEPAPTRPTGADPTGGPGREPAVPTSWRGRRSS